MKHTPIKVNGKEVTNAQLASALKTPDDPAVLKEPAINFLVTRMNLSKEVAERYLK